MLFHIIFICLLSIVYSRCCDRKLGFSFQNSSTQYIKGAFHSTKNSEISGPKLNGTVKIPGKVFENLGIRFECTL